MPEKGIDPGSPESQASALTTRPSFLSLCNDLELQILENVPVVSEQGWDILAGYSWSSGVRMDNQAGQARHEPVHHGMPTGGLTGIV